METLFDEEFFEKLPPLVPRCKIRKYLGSLISPRYLANLDSLGKGPIKKVCGGKVCYKRADLIKWLEERTK